MLAHIFSRCARLVDDQAKESKHCEVMLKQMKEAEHQRFCNWNRAFWLQDNERQLPIMKLKGNFSQRFEESRSKAIEKADEYGVKLDVTKILEQEAVVTKKFSDLVKLVSIWKAASQRENELKYIDENLNLLLTRFKDGDQLYFEEVNKTLQICHRVLHGPHCSCELLLTVGKYESDLLIPN